MLFVGVVRPAEGQSIGVAWERVGVEGSVFSRNTTSDLDFLRGVADDGSSDTLLTVNVEGVFRYAPSASEWEPICTQSRCRADRIVVAKDDAIIIGMRAGPSSGGTRSADRGVTWERDVIGYGVTVLFQSSLPSLSQAVYAGNGAALLWSTEGGEAGTWNLGDPTGGEPASIAEVYPSASLPSGRLVAGTWNGAVYSDDGGRSWEPSTLSGTGYLAVNSVAFLPDPDHAFAGVVFAGVRNFNLGYPALYRSDDGGVVWSRVRTIEPGDFGIVDPELIVVEAGRHGAVYAGIDDLDGATPSTGKVIGSLDGGETWTVVGDSTNGWGGYGAKLLRLGRDGRLYAGTDQGVWRSVERVPTSRSSLDRTNAETAIELSVAPNPIASMAGLAFVLNDLASIDISIYDLLGRKVETIVDERLTPGRHSRQLSRRRFARGTYLLVGRAIADDGRDHHDTILVSFQ